jgi:hypothetical protein
MATILRYTAILAMCCATAKISAQPALSLSQEVAGITVFRDAKKSNLFYYMPFDYKLVTSPEGRPEFSLVQMRYTGTRATDDAGAIKYHNLLQFRVAVDPTQNQKVNAIKTELKKTNSTAELRPLPVRKFSSVLVFAGTSDTVVMDDSVRLMKTSSDLTDENATVNNSYWTDRTITIRLGNEDAQLVETALKNHSSAMSFSYAFYTIFSEMAPGDLEVSGNKKVQKKIRDYFSQEIRNQHDSALKITLVKADAISLAPDPAAWEGLIQKVDINEKLPAKYPLFDVYCYDFNNALRADLYAKKIEIKATSLNGAEISTSFSFRASQPERYTRSIRFPYAVRFDKPFYYRVTEITLDGEASMTPWIEKKEWSELLDITSAPDKIVKPVDPDQ